MLDRAPLYLIAFAITGLAYIASRILLVLREISDKLDE